MTEQRLIEEILDGIRALRRSDTDTKVKLEGITVQLQNMTSMRRDFEGAQRDIASHDARLEALEELQIGARLKKVENATFRIMAAALMLIGAIELLDKFATFIAGV